MQKPRDAGNGDRDRLRVVFLGVALKRAAGHKRDGALSDRQHGSIAEVIVIVAKEARRVAARDRDGVIPHRAILRTGRIGLSVALRGIGERELLFKLGLIIPLPACNIKAVDVCRNEGLAIGQRVILLHKGNVQGALENFKVGRIATLNFKLIVCRLPARAERDGNVPCACIGGNGVGVSADCTILRKFTAVRLSAPCVGVDKGDCVPFEQIIRRCCDRDRFGIILLTIRRNADGDRTFVDRQCTAVNKYKVVVRRRKRARRDRICVFTDRNARIICANVFERIGRGAGDNGRTVLIFPRIYRLRRTAHL